MSVIGQRLSLAGPLTGLGSFLIEKGELAEAEEHLREAEAIYRKLYTHSNLQLGDNLRLLAQTLKAERRYPEAEAMINENVGNLSGGDGADLRQLSDRFDGARADLRANRAPLRSGKAAPRSRADSRRERSQNAFSARRDQWRSRGIPERPKPLRGSRALSTRELREPKKFTSRRESAHPAGPPAAGSALRKLEKAGGSRSLSA